MKLDECLPALPRGDVYSMKRDDQAKTEYWTERQVVADRLACARAGALAALDEAITTCEAVGLKNTIEGYFDVDESAECTAAIRHLRDTIMEGK